MEPIIIFALFGISALFIAYGDDDTAESEDTPDEETPIVPVDSIVDETDGDGNDADNQADETDPVLIDSETGAYLVGPGQTAIGTDGGDLFTLVEGADYVYPRDEDNTITIVAGDGADNIILGSVSFGSIFGSINGGAGDDVVRAYNWGGEIDGGDGDDDIQVTSRGGSIEGGAGNDLIFNIKGAGPTDLYGGDGDDHLIGRVVYTDKSDLLGGAGNDIVDGRDMDNADLYGGAGDDVIYTCLRGSTGAGYSVVAYGGDGDDRLIHNDTAPASWYSDIAPRLVGGDGSDSFEISFSEVNKDNTGASQSSVVGILDFESGVDTIQINAMIDYSDAYSVVSAELQENTERGSTTLTVTYKAEPDPLDPDNSLPDRKMNITIVGTGLTWDDITFVGDNIPPVLVPTI